MDQAAPFVGVISAVIMWFGLIIVLAMFKSFISHGLSIALAELLFRTTDRDFQEKMVRWFANEDIVLSTLEKMREKLQNEEEKD